MSQDEVFDIYDEEMTKIGVERREIVHAKGYWHQTFHCWIVNRTHNGGAKLLLQLRHPDKDTYPGLLDISSAGHLQSGETVEDGVRELEEELGIRAAMDELVYCGMVPQEKQLPMGLIDREFNHIFIYEFGKPLEAYEYQADEISGLFFAELEDFKRLVSGEVDRIEIEGIVNDESEYSGSLRRREIGPDDVTPRSDEYYNLLFQKIADLTS
ncbi:NUDIX domain-containing protein [Paenibacillus sp. M1]|uniref:NUDIX domain-containing protein n=1 Tax=Paenibacillus haidiansis TaxID=1574488 RepID=A0ABU7VNL6_9BACL